MSELPKVKPWAVEPLSTSQESSRAALAWLEPIRSAGRLYREQLAGRMPSSNLTKERRKRLARMRVVASELRALLEDDGFAIVDTLSVGVANFLDERDDGSVLQDLVDTISNEFSVNPPLRGRPPKDDRRRFWTICALCYENRTGRTASTSRYLSPIAFLVDLSNLL